MTCVHAHDDGVYVLGALAPTERLELERHLDECPDCARRVRELAGLTGLLARVPAEVLEAADPHGRADAPAVPASVLPGLLGSVRRDRRRRRRLTVVLAAAAATVGVALGAVGTGLLADEDPAPGPGATPSAPTMPGEDASPGPTAPTATPDGAPARPMRPVRGSDVPMTARLSLTGVPWGTRLDLTCSYPVPEAPGRGTYGSAAGGERTAYTMVVRTRAGEVERVATWRALPGETMRLTAATAAAREAIAVVQVRTADGSPVLRLRG